jgi:hypothetical protein
MPKAKSSQNAVMDTLNMLESELGKVFTSKKIPSLPDNVKELLVKLSPWFVTISMIMLLPLILAAFGLSAVAMPFSYLGGLHMGFSYTIGMVFTFGMILLELMAIPGLFKREQKAWRLIFYSTLLSLVQQLLNWNLGSLMIGGAISFYFLFQVKSKYTK